MRSPAVTAISPRRALPGADRRGPAPCARFPRKRRGQVPIPEKLRSARAPGRNTKAGSSAEVGWRLLMISTGAWRACSEVNAPGRCGADRSHGAETGCREMPA